jgi:hypothetical protein
VQEADSLGCHGFYSLFDLVGFGAAKPPQDLPFLAGCGGSAAAASRNKGWILEGLQPSKPPACV